MSDDSINTVTTTDFGGWFSATPTAGLRFIKHGEQRILQQQWKIEHSKKGQSFEWKDIPLEE